VTTLQLKSVKDKIKVKHLFLGFSLLLPIIVGVIAVVFYPNYLSHFTLPHTLFPLILFLIISPVLEEVVFRGLFQDFLLSWLNNKFIAIGLLNIGFAVFHYNINHDPTYMFLVFCCGIILSVQKLKYGKLIYPIFFHAYYNLSFMFMHLTYVLWSH